MIEIVYRSGPPEALCCAALICDACREQIIINHTDIHLTGNACYWSKRDSQGRASTSPMLLAHKGYCDQLLERVLSGEFYRIQDGWHNGWEEIDTFLEHLGHNAVNPFSSDEEGTYHFAGIVPPPAELMLQVSKAVRSHLGLPAEAKHLSRPNGPLRQ